MANYNFKIIKVDHPGELHIHVYFNNSGQFGKLLGKFKIPSLEPVSGTNHSLNEKEVGALKEWLGEERQLRKLQDCLESTLFDSHELAKRAFDKFSEGKVIKEEGKTFITVKIPVVDRI